MTEKEKELLAYATRQWLALAIWKIKAVRGDK